MTGGEVEVYTDGACKGNPGVGGWGVLLQYGDRTRELCGGEAHTTNNRMELTAVIRALANHPLTASGLAAFDADWAKTGQTIA